MLRSKIYHEEVGRLRAGTADKQNAWDAWKADTGDKPSEEYMKEIIGEPLSESEISRIASARADAMLADRLSLDAQPLAEHLEPGDDIKAMKQTNADVENTVESNAPIFKSKEELAAMEAAKIHAERNHTMDNVSLSHAVPENKVDTGNYVLTSTHNVHYPLNINKEKVPAENIDIQGDFAQVHNEDNALNQMFKKVAKQHHDQSLSNTTKIKM